MIITMGEVKGHCAPRGPSRRHAIAICVLASMCVGSTTKLLLDARRPGQLEYALQVLGSHPDEQQAQEALAVLHRAVQPSLHALAEHASRQDAVGDSARIYLAAARDAAR